jgi:hypothetical protein
MAVSRTAAFETETGESCRSLGMDPADPCRPVSLVEIRPECANNGLTRLTNFHEQSRVPDGWRLRFG